MKVVRVRWDDAARQRFGNALRSLRKQKSREGGKVTQEAIAKLAGISAGYIAALEAGHRNPPKSEKLPRLAQAYGTTEDELLRAAQGLYQSTAESPASNLEWAFKAVVSDPTYAFFAETELPLTAKFNIVQVYELSRGRQLLTAEEKAAIAEMTADKEQSGEAADEYRLTDYSHYLLDLMKKYSGADAIPTQEVAGAFLGAMCSESATMRHK